MSDDPKHQPGRTDLTAATGRVRTALAEPCGMGGAGQPADRSAAFSALRARVGRMERGSSTGAGAIPLCDPIDATLPGGGLDRAAVHEVHASDPGAAAAFCAMVLARAKGTVLWISASPDAWPPGLSAFGLDPGNLVMVRADRASDGLWAFEEALRSPAVAGALLAVRDVPPDMVASRRLQLAAEAGGGIGLALMPAAGPARPSTARTRWRVGAAASVHRDRPSWDVTLLRGKGARTGTWSVTWDCADRRLALRNAAAVPDQVAVSA